MSHFIKRAFISLANLRNVAAVLLALTVKELFPKALLLGGRATSLGFYYNFFLPFPFDKNFLKQIEERMLFSILKKEKVSFREMVPYSAKQYFLSRKESFLVDQVERSLSSTVSLLEIAGQMFLTEAEGGVKDLGEIGSVKILKEEVLGKGKVRIHGTAFSSKMELKEFFKEKGDWVGVSHEILGEKKGLFSFYEGTSCFWFSKGLQLKSQLLQKLEKLAEEFGVNFVSTKSVSEEIIITSFLKDQWKMFEKTGGKDLKKVCGENVTVCGLDDNVCDFGLFDTPVYVSNISWVFCRESFLLEEVISCLHFVTKIFKILGFEFRMVLVEKPKSRSKWLKDGFLKAFDTLETETREDLKDGSRIECRIQDRLGLEWPVSCVYAPRKVEGREGFFFLPFSLFLSLERIIALIVEKSKEELLF